MPELLSTAVCDVEIPAEPAEAVPSPSMHMAVTTPTVASARAPLLEGRFIEAPLARPQVPFSGPITTEEADAPQIHVRRRPGAGYRWRMRTVLWARITMM